MVHIRRVDIFGFKSFGFKNISINFEPGLVTISGPNGSGKSNILDAVIFALGENKPKVMRADKLRSLIHDIEGARRGPKLARACVVFDNSDRKIPVEADTVEITREMDDKGENIYHLNKKQTQRSQILDLLEVANAGLNQLNTVQQGTVTRLSEFSPEEKRQVIENLIGLTYFDEKKAEAEKQLQQADQRLEVALARMDEVKKQIDTLEEERNLKLRYDFIEHEINRLNAIDAAGKMKVIKENKLSKERNLHALSSQVQKFDEERTSLRKEIHTLDSQKSSFMDEVNAYNQQKATIDIELSTVMQKYEEVNSTIIASKKRTKQIELRFPKIEEDIKQIETDRGSLDSETAKLKKEVEKKQAQKANTTDEIRAVDQEVKDVLNKQSQIFTKKREFDSKIKHLTDKINEVRLILNKLHSRRTETENKITLNITKSKNFDQESHKLYSLKKQLESVSQNHKATIEELKNRINGFEQKRQKNEKDIEDLNLILEKSSKAAAEYDSKIRTVKEVMHEDYSVAKLKEVSDKLGIEGLVYEIISWDKKYERPILAVSSDWIKAIVVKDFATLLSIAEVARTKKLPRFKIIPLDAIPDIKLELPKEKGAVGVLSDFVKCDKRLSQLKTFLFGNVILADSRDSAFRISKLGYKVVTKEGEFFESKTRAVIVDINSKISKLTKIISMSTSVEGLIQSISLLNKYIQKKKANLKKIEQAIENHRERISLSETGLANANQSNSDLTAKMSQLYELKTQYESRIIELKRLKDNLDSEISGQESFIEAIKQRISIVEENYSEGEHVQVSNELKRLNEKKSDLEAKLTETIAEEQDLKSQLANINVKDSEERSKIRNLEQERQELVIEKQELETKIKTLESEIAPTNEELVKLREKEQELISTSGTSVSKLKEFDSKLHELNEKERHLTREINALERQIDSMQRDLKDLSEDEAKVQKILDAYGLDETLEAFDVDPILKGLYAEQRHLTDLNAKAPSVYLEISYGYRSMSTRKNSLEEERNSIVKFIETIERDKKQTFLDAFDKVDKEIRHAFNTMTGGNAWLEIQNEDDIFNSGLSYLIQFPNKPKRESTSISGGEKTLAAVVFVLALQKLKPSPFYLFDEVDAHLDAPNSEKLAKILEERSKESQFIVVSLKDSVVQKAKLIYGVFPKNGVSHVVTYKDKRLPSMVATSS